METNLLSISEQGEAHHHTVTSGGERRLSVTHIWKEKEWNLLSENILHSQKQ